MEPVFGVYRGTVRATDDPDQLGRVRVAVTGVGGSERAWAPVATLAAGPNRGTWFVPESGDEVVVAFEAGDARRPIVLGSLWTVEARPPSADTGRAVIRMRTIEIEDQNGNEIALEPAGIRASGRPRRSGRRSPCWRRTPRRAGSTRAALASAAPFRPRR